MGKVRDGNVLMLKFSGMLFEQWMLLLSDSIADMLVALEGILQSENERILSLTVEVLTKLLSRLGSSIRQFHVVEVVFALSRLLLSSHPMVTISSVVALKYILTNFGSMSPKFYVGVWNALENANTVCNISLALQDYVVGISSSEYFMQMSSLLKIIMWKWPPSRYHVWSNKNLMAKLEGGLSDSDSNIVVSILQLCSALALCGNGALKILENKELISKIVCALESSRPHDVRVEALKTCQQLSTSQEGCSKLTNSHGESIVKGIVAAMSELRSSDFRKVTPDQMNLVKEAFRSALITRWAGIHHSCFWKLKVDRILFGVLFGSTSSAFENQIVFHSNKILTKLPSSNIDLRPYIWNILGWIAVHCAEDFPNNGKSGYLETLINNACAMANEFWINGITFLSSESCEVELVSRAVLLMVFSPCKYISSQARTCLSEVAKTSGDKYLEKLITCLMLNFREDVSPVSYSLHTFLISLACYSTLPLYQQFIVQRKGIDLLVSIIRKCLESEIHASRSGITSHLHGSCDGELCCWSNIEDWEGGDLILFHSLQILSQLAPFSNLICDYSKIISRDYATSNTSGGMAESLFKCLSTILENNYSPGIKGYAQYTLSFFGLYGYPSKFGKRMYRALAEDELADIQFLLSSDQRLRVHGAILVASCPYLLPPKESFIKKNLLDCESFKKSRQHGTIFRHEVKLSEHVDCSAFVKILEYVYTGFVIVKDDEVKPVRILAKQCGLNSLSYMLNRKLPAWGVSVSSCDFSHALEQAEHHLSDIILEANKMTGATWTCTICVSTMPHIHANRVILLSNCGYLRALFQSGMSESYSSIIKVPVGFEALTKLVTWFYTGILPRINLDCNWNNMATSQQFHELQVYVELSSLAEFWLLKEVEEESLNVVLLCLEQNQKLSMEIMDFALKLHQWRIVKAAASNIAHLYPKMRDLGDLENLSEEAVDLLRSEYVRHSQKGFS
ncbi:BTB/POZ domain-containing protein At1g04390 isoform X2 [Phalaenopsis equestris]|uniref:BTB/POZ domain-containing protein At1g04390 isoform X2 n=1 Tax=Phalaenopsis equestris TaxID=78828 RepID=UPI0009E34919|nr:BTB/POZ domain-containing protein At1g04390 isoform X2 [Phalaenopsis equestris]XP_020587248.1 BTB/POZ domain-containing protein At1g04390 isoform X2 [Phalaenopsis equestris]